MNGIKVIPAHIHGITDYPTGIALLLAPNLFGFDHLGGAPVWIPRILGVAILGMAVLTNYRVGLIRLIPMSVHLMIDYVAGIFLAASPFLFGFSDEPANAWLPHVVVGLMIFVITLLTQTHSDTETAPLTQTARDVR